ncbi:MAG: ATP-binding protein [Lachnospiraceae bacterium]|nr:ATP-binding protein [Lachnospiraceae bacterium]
MNRMKELVIYRGMRRDDIFGKFETVMTAWEDNGGHGFTAEKKEELLELLFDGIHGLIEEGQKRSFQGNLWHAHLTYLMANDENAFSRFCEKKGSLEGSINSFVLHDLSIMKGLFQYDFTGMEEALGVSFVSLMESFEPACAKGIVFNKLLRDRMNELSARLAEAENEKAMLSLMAAFYKDYGVGNFGLHKSFRIRHEGEAAKIVPITNSENIRLTDLIGYEKQKKQLIDNTEAFIQGEKANNVLLFGESGTGKSSSVKAILNEYYKDGLRMIEIFKHQFGDLTSVIEQIKDRNYKFIIYMDDLSFEETELEYKYLKAVIEGGLEKRPDNVLIYATSNRRHIVKERWDERKQSADDVHGNDSKEEKLSLYARFGVTIYYGSPMQKDYLKIVDGIADRMGLTMDREKLHQEAIRWELAHGGFSGRVAEQCVSHLLALTNMANDKAGKSE